MKRKLKLMKEVKAESDGWEKEDLVTMVVVVGEEGLVYVWGGLISGEVA